MFFGSSLGCNRGGFLSVSRDGGSGVVGVVGVIKLEECVFGWIFA